MIVLIVLLLITLLNIHAIRGEVVHLNGDHDQIESHRRQLINKHLVANNTDPQWLLYSEKQWDREWKTGKWEFMEAIPIERCRIATISGVFVPAYSGNSAAVLDIGCGEGAISDFLSAEQKTKYVGVDISKEAVQVAQQKRKGLQFVHAAAHEYQGQKNQFDAIIFSEVLYYVSHENILKQYEQYLKPNGVIIISIFHRNSKLFYEEIFQYARTRYDMIDEMDVIGFTRKNRNAPKERTAFRIEIYRIKPPTPPT